MNSAVTHDVITISIPFLAILAGTFFNNRAIAKVESEVKALRDETRGEIKDVRGEIKELRATIEKRFDRVDDHLTRLHSITGEHEGRIQALERQR